MYAYNYNYVYEYIVCILDYQKFVTLRPISKEGLIKSVNDE